MFAYSCNIPAYGSLLCDHFARSRLSCFFSLSFSLLFCSCLARGLQRGPLQTCDQTRIELEIAKYQKFSVAWQRFGKGFGFCWPTTKKTFVCVRLQWPILRSVPTKTFGEMGHSVTCSAHYQFSPIGMHAPSSRVSDVMHTSICYPFTQQTNHTHRCACILILYTKKIHKTYTYFYSFLLRFWSILCNDHQIAISKNNANRLHFNHWQKSVHLCRLKKN